MPSTATTTVLDVLIAELRSGRINLANARAAFEHSPNGNTEHWLTDATAHLDALLDSYLDLEAAQS